MAFLFSLEQAKSLLDDPLSCFKCVTSTKKITLPHYFVGDHRQGAKEFLNLRLKRYSETLDGILITYYDTMVLSRNGCIMGDNPFFSFDIRANFIVFRPHIGSTLKGVVNKLSPAHIGCLVHGHFNASIFKENEEEWNSPHVQVGSRITFEVTSLDLYSRIIFIRGKLLGVEEPDSSFLQENYEVVPYRENEKIITINKTSSSLNKIKFDTETDDDSDVDSQKIVHLDIEQSTKKSPKRETKGKINELGKLSAKGEKQKLASRNIVFHKDSSSSDSDNVSKCQGNDEEETHNTNSSSIASSSAVSPKKSTKSKSSLSDKRVKKMKSIKKTPVASIEISPKERKVEPMSSSDSSDSDMFSPEKSTNKNTPKAVLIASQKRDRKADSPSKKVTTKTISEKTSNSVKDVNKNGKSNKGSEIDQDVDLSAFDEAEISKIFEQAELEKSSKKKKTSSEESLDLRKKKKSSSGESSDSRKKKKSSSEESSDSRKNKKSSSGESSDSRKNKKSSSGESTDSKKKKKHKKRKDANKDEKRKKKKSMKEKKLESESAEKKTSGSNRKRKLSETSLPQAKHRKKSKKEMTSKE